MKDTTESGVEEGSVPVARTGRCRAGAAGSRPCANRGNGSVAGEGCGCAGAVKPPYPRSCVHEQRSYVHDSFSNVARERMPRLSRRRRKNATRRNARSYRRPSLSAPLKRNIGERIVQQARCLPLDPCRRAGPFRIGRLAIGRNGAFPTAKGRSGAPARFSRDGGMMYAYMGLPVKRCRDRTYVGLRCPFRSDTVKTLSNRCIPPLRWE